MFFNRRKEIIKKINAQLLEVEKWNKQTFRDATLGGQLEKLEEEFDELHRAEDDSEAIKETADVFIVIGGLIRWNSKVGVAIKNIILEKSNTASLKILSAAIDAKMEINRKRKWHKAGNGKFHH